MLVTAERLRHWPSSFFHLDCILVPHSSSRWRRSSGLEPLRPRAGLAQPCRRPAKRIARGKVRAHRQLRSDGRTPLLSSRQVLARLDLVARPSASQSLRDDAPFYRERARAVPLLTLNGAKTSVPTHFSTADVLERLTFPSDGAPVREGRFYLLRGYQSDDGD